MFRDRWLSYHAGNVTIMWDSWTRKRHSHFYHVDSSYVGENKIWDCGTHNLSPMVCALFSLLILVITIVDARLLPWQQAFCHWICTGTYSHYCHSIIPQIIILYCFASIPSSGAWRLTMTTSHNHLSLRLSTRWEVVVVSCRPYVWCYIIR